MASDGARSFASVSAEPSVTSSSSIRSRKQPSGTGWRLWRRHQPPKDHSVRRARSRPMRARHEHFVGWLVERGTLLCSPMSERAFPRTSVPLPHVVSPATFEHMVRAGFSHESESACGKAHLPARDQALLWVFFDTGITVSEACALRVADLDPQTGLLRVRGKGGKERQMALGSTCLSHLRAYLRQMDQATRSGLTSRQAGGDPLFGSQGKQPLTKNGVTMVFARFRKRAGISETPSALRSYATALPCAISRQEETHRGYRNCWAMREWLRSGSICAGLTRCSTTRCRKGPKKVAEEL